MLPQCHCTSLDHHILERNFYRAEFIHLYTGRHRIVHIDLHREIKMRSSKHAFTQTTGNRFPHLTVWSINKFLFSCRSELCNRLLWTGCWLLTACCRRLTATSVSYTHLTLPTSDLV